MTWQRVPQPPPPEWQIIDLPCLGCSTTITCVSDSVTAEEQLCNRCALREERERHWGRVLKPGWRERLFGGRRPPRHP